ncbi:HAE1 family hydrophobic/amphiphilic exporter-1/multidrug efflux pump [Panacagrimonas perspica]|uniref:Efflux pump membrane transporter n=1 Tax=Panacagrimonas perspica TaxID=381431 RepID=A0A4R7NUH5_9GAMM|nr:multidrug efflux RND transporter permease subunit [Panacagrimonas perspica]TDU24389.1 HAE1 family hydrophobic/amphiphilic exporter-1/multidrug efflux pump [Panacagrimonas perspica]THD04775.1 RND transporter [Panacagrimonas perspica]
MVNFFIDRPIFAAVISIIITIAGAISLTQLPVARFPQIVPPSIVVSTNFPGADAATVEQSIAAPIEQQVNGVEKMLYMSSKSGNDGSYALTVTFDIGTDQDIAAVQVQNRVAIAQRQLPQEVVRQGVTVTKRQPQILMLVTLRATDPKFDYLFLSNYATLNVYDALARVPGVGQVIVFGARDYGMRIWLDPEKMARLGVTTQDIASVLNEQNVVAPAGTVGAEPAPKGQEKQYAVYVKGRLTSTTEYENVVVRAQRDGSLVQLKDIARIELAATDYNRANKLNGEPSAGIGIYQLPDANALDVRRGVQKAMEDLSKSFPKGIEYAIPFDITQFVSESVNEVVHTLVIATILVLVVVFLFLESWRATLIPMLAVPISIIGAFSAFVALGFSINTLTLFALVLAIGLVVDDAIVVVEAVTAKMDANKRLTAREATREAMAEVAGPVVAIALVLSAVFIPAAFLPGLTGQFYRQFAITLSISVLISLLVALSFTPALCAMLLRPSEESHLPGVLGKMFGAFNRGFARATESYSRTVQRGIRRSAIGIAVFGVLTVAAGWLVLARPGGFLPDEDQGYLLVSIQLPPGASMQRTEQVMLKYDEAVRKIQGVDNVIEIIGFSFLSGITNSSSGTSFISLKPWGDRGSKHSAQEILKELQAATSKITDANFLVINPPSIPGIGSGGGFEFILEDRTGGQLGGLVGSMGDLLSKANQNPELTRVFTVFNPNTPQVEYAIDRERAKTLGIPISDIFSSLQTFFGGSYINDFNLFGRTYRVTAQADGHARASPEAVNQLYVRSKDGDMVPLSTLVSTKMRQTPDYIERFNIFRSVTINGSGAPGVSSGEAMAAMERLAADLPAGYMHEWSGVSFQERRASGQAQYIFAASVLFVFLVLAALYESWVVPFAVLLGIPFAVFGAFLALTFRGFANDVYAQIGLVMLIGLAAKNSILIVEFAKLGYERGMPLAEAAVEGAKARLRPILMTSFAFILGTLPLVIASGAGAAARQVLGTTVVFGMLAATLIGIFLVPVFYVVIQGTIDRFRGGPSHPHAPSAERPQEAVS